MTTENIATIIDLLKYYYYADFIVMFFMFIMGMGLGLSFRELLEEILKNFGKKQERTIMTFMAYSLNISG